MIFVLVTLICGQPDLIIYHNKTQINVIPYSEIATSEPLSEQLIINLNQAIQNKTYFEIIDDRGECI